MVRQLALGCGLLLLASSGQAASSASEFAGDMLKKIRAASPGTEYRISSEDPLTIEIKCEGEWGNAVINLHRIYEYCVHSSAEDCEGVSAEFVTRVTAPRFLLKVLAGFVLTAGGMTSAVDQRGAEPAEVVFGRAESELKLKTEFFLSILGDEHYDWDVDLDAGTITFIGTTKIVTAPVQVIGTYNTLDQTFLWGWDHPSVPDALAADARRARVFGGRQNLPLFTTRKVECTQEQAWVFTAVALYLAGAQGAYRAPSGTTMVFVTFGKMTIAPID